MACSEFIFSISFVLSAFLPLFQAVPSRLSSRCRRGNFSFPSRHGARFAGTHLSRIAGGFFSNRRGKALPGPHVFRLPCARPFRLPHASREREGPCAQDNRPNRWHWSDLLGKLLPCGSHASVLFRAVRK